MRSFKLSTVLRARQAQEDMARGTASRAGSDRDTSHRSAVQREHALYATSPPPPGTALAVVAAIAAGRALAAGLAAARRIAEEADQHHAQRLEELTVATKRRRSVERLAERHIAHNQRHALAVDQRAIDEIASRIRFHIGGTA